MKAFKYEDEIQSERGKLNESKPTSAALKSILIAGMVTARYVRN
jgi:hypothetical protein